MGDFLLTNNEKVQARYAGVFPVEYLDGPLEAVMVRARDYVHRGHRLLTHPLSGSVKPNQTPFKSILIAGEPAGLDMDSLRIIEGCLDTCRKLPQRPRTIPPEILDDYRSVDLALIESALPAHGAP